MKQSTRPKPRTKDDPQPHAPKRPKPRGIRR